MKFVEPNITFAPSVLVEKISCNELLYVINFLTINIKNNSTHIHISQNGVFRILRYICIDNYIVWRFINLKVNVENIKNYYQFDKEFTAHFSNTLFLNSSYNNPVFKEEYFYDIFDSSTIVCYNEIFPIVSRFFIEIMKNENELNNITFYKKQIIDFQEKFPFLIGGKNNHTPNLFINYHRPIELSLFLEDKNIFKLKSRTNSWLKGKKRKDIRLLNREIVIPV
jgi:hypothetical protein